MAKQRMRGRVTSISEHGDGKHATVNVAHGRRKPKEKGETYPYDDRISSSLVMPKEKAKNFSVGQAVNAGLDSASATLDDDTGEDLDMMSKRLKGKR